MAYRTVLRRLPPIRRSGLLIPHARRLHGASCLRQAEALDGSILDHALLAAKENNLETLPASWFRNDKLCDLEKRAIYSKSWFMTTTTSEFTKPGDYRVFDLAGYSIFLVMDSDRKINGFHNVCRHRAYPLRTKDSGCSGVISCGYHAWTWDTKGNLMKAPSFDNVPGFDKTSQGLFPIHLHFSPSGCIFVNLEASDEPSVSFEESFPGLDDLLSGYDFKKYKLHRHYETIADFNWKTRVDGFQECYHCMVSHPNFSKTFDIPNYRLENRNAYSVHNAKPLKSAPENSYGGDGLFLYLYPSGAINCFDAGWQTSFTSPIDGGKAKVRFEYYVDPSLSDEAKDAFVDTFKEVEDEDMELCVQTQKGLDAGIYSRGVLHPTKENGVLHYQALTRKLVLEHAAKEREAGCMINPAAIHPATMDHVDALPAEIEKLSW